MKRPTLLKKKEIPPFRKCVYSREQNDLIISGLAALLVILVPIISYIIIDVLSGTETKYAVMADHLAKAKVVCISLELFIIMFILYRMYTRLITHSSRDRLWMRSLILFCNTQNCDTSQLEDCYEYYTTSFVFWRKRLIKFLMAAMFVFLSCIFIFIVPNITSLDPAHTDLSWALPGGLNITINSAYLIFIVEAAICLTMAVVVLTRAVNFPFYHETRQIRFTEILADTLNDVGITIYPMAPVVKGRSRIASIVLTIITVGMYLFYLMFKAFRDMNYHMMNQWRYENSLLMLAETSDSDFEYSYESSSPFYKEYSPEESKVRKKEVKTFTKAVRKQSREENNMPKLLIIAQLFLTGICVSYVLGIVSADYIIATHPENFIFDLQRISEMPLLSWLYIVIIIMDVFFLLSTADSLLEVTSRRSASWRKVVRSCFSMVIPMWLTELALFNTGIENLFDFNPYITTAVLAVVLIIMVTSKRIREYYTPYGYDVPNTLTWIRFAIGGKLVSYRKEGEMFSRAKSSKESAEEFEDLDDEGLYENFGEI